MKPRTQRLRTGPEARRVNIADVELLDLLIGQHPRVIRIEQPDVLLAGDLEKQIRFMVDMVGRDDGR
jgi:hypothetical protein